MGPGLTAAERQKKAIEDDENKRIALEKRHAEAEKWRKFYWLARGKPTWKPVAGSSPESDIPTITSATDPGPYKEGLYTMVAGTDLNLNYNIFVDANGNIKPVPPTATDSEFRHAYSMAMDFLSAGQGYHSIKVDWPNGAQVTKEKLKILCELAEKKGLAIEFGPNVQAFLHGLPKNEMDEFYIIKDRIRDSAYQTRLLADIGNPTFDKLKNRIENAEKLTMSESEHTNALLKTDDDHAAKLKKIEEEQKDITEKLNKVDPTDNEAKKSLEQEQKNLTQRLNQVNAAIKDEKLKTIEQEHKRITERLNQVNAAVDEMNRHLNASVNLLNNPDAIKKTGVIPGKQKWVGDANSVREELSADPMNKVPSRIRDDRNATAASRSALLDALHKERDDLAARQRSCVAALKSADLDDAALAEGSPQRVKREELKKLVGLEPAEGVAQNLIKTQESLDKIAKAEMDLNKALAKLQPAPLPGASI